MSKVKAPATAFDWIGQLLDFVIKDGYKIKYLRLAVAGREYWVKVPKSLRAELDPAIGPGSQLAVRGWASRCTKTGKLKLRAESVELIGTAEGTIVVPSPRPRGKAASGKSAKILVCTKSSCRKRGAEAICMALQENLKARGLAERVSIKPTGCLKACKHGPNAVVMPAKARYGSLKAAQVPALIDKHFAGDEGDTRVASPKHPALREATIDT